MLLFITVGALTLYCLLEASSDDPDWLDVRRPFDHLFAWTRESVPPEDALLWVAGAVVLLLAYYSVMFIY